MRKEKEFDLFDLFTIDNMGDGIFKFDAINTNYKQNGWGTRRYKNADGNITFVIDCPGFNKDTLSVEIDKSLLTVSGEIVVHDMPRKINERINIGTSDEVEAEIKDGVLTLVFKQPGSKSVKVTVK